MNEDNSHLGDEGVEAGADLARAQVARGRDELDPQGHGALAAVAEFKEGAAGRAIVVHEVEDAHLVQVQDHLEKEKRQMLVCVWIIGLKERRGNPKSIMCIVCI